MAPNRRSVPTSLSLSDSSDPESWGSPTINNHNNNSNTNIGKVKTLITTTSEIVNGSTNGHFNGNSNGHYVNTTIFNTRNHINRIQVNSSNDCVTNDKINGSVNVSSSSSSTTTITTTTNSSSSLNHNHHHQHRENNINGNHDQHPWKNWPKIDLISSIDPFESSDSMISAFACVAHVINSDSANEEEEDQIDGDNEIIRITGDNSENGNDDYDEDNGSYDSSNHPNSLESPENYRPIHKPQSLVVDYKSNNDKINSKLNGKCSINDKYINKSDQVNTIKPSPPPLSTIPRPLQQPPPPPVSSSSSSSTKSTIITTPTTSSTLFPNQINSPTSKSTIPSNCSSITTPITAKDHLYETIYPSNIRLTRESKYFSDYQNYRSILSHHIESASSSLNPTTNGHTSIKVNQSNPTNDNPNHSASIDLINSKDNKEMVRRANYSSSPSSSSSSPSSSSITGRNSYKNVTGRLSTSSTVNQSYNQVKSIQYNQNQRTKPQSYNYHHPHHQHHLPGHSNSSSLYKPSLSSSSSSLMSPPPPSSPSPISQLNQGDHNQRLMKKLSDNSSSLNNNNNSNSNNNNNNYYHSSSSKSSTISRPTYLKFNKSTNQLFDEVDGKLINNNNPQPSTIGNKVTNEKLQSTQISSIDNINKDKNVDNQIEQQTIKLKPDQVYPNSISIPIISRANVRSTEEYATIIKSRSINSMKSSTLTPSSPINNEEIKLLSKDDSNLISESKGKQSIESPMSLNSLSSLSPTNSPSTSSIGNNLIETKHKSIKSKSKDKSSGSPLSQSSSSSSRSFFSRFFSLTHVISRTFSVEKIDKHHRSLNDHGKGTNLIKSAVSTPALTFSTRSNTLLNDLNGNNNQFPSTRTLIDSPTGSYNNQETIEPVSLTTSNSGSKSLQTKSSSSFVRAFKNRLSLRRSRRKVKVKVDVTRTKSDPRVTKSNRYEDDKMIPKQSMKEETIHGSIVATNSGDHMKIVEIHRPQGKPFGFFVAVELLITLKVFSSQELIPMERKPFRDYLKSVTD
ncbi:probable serine/threonine-protein kinase DDB_G0282963 [Panonychus citri]|uniref:probable serine/threonine-protein kinase DDB_G0282963 n=1 Tax=Panonychus citri TaxID=50023 RepID=UPI0023081322|nr:probable serine/threonine-protein kinase DDB_G0282963 [Panonychus citri]